MSANTNEENGVSSILEVPLACGGNVVGKNVMAAGVVAPASVISACKSNRESNTAANVTDPNARKIPSRTFCKVKNPHAKKQKTASVYIIDGNPGRQPLLQSTPTQKSKYTCVKRSIDCTKTFDDRASNALNICFYRYWEHNGRSKHISQNRRTTYSKDKNRR